ncbi:MAG: hypothetical protein NVS1B11_37040 [Terriglobales bacterium]
MKKLIAGSVVLTLLFLSGAKVARADFLGIPGIPTLTWDPAVAADIVKSIATAQRLIAVTNGFVNLYRTAQMYVSGKAGWRGAVSLLQHPAIRNLVGETAGWDRAIQTGTNVAGVWDRSTVPMKPNVLILNDRQNAANLATVEIGDSAGMYAIQALGQGGTDRTSMDNALSSLESFSLNGEARTNTELQQLNSISAGTTLGLHFNQQQDNKLRALLQLQLVEEKRRRDELAGHLQYLSDLQTEADKQKSSCVSCTERGLAP